MNQDTPSSYERTFIIGDIHGCRRLLERLLERIGWVPGKDRLVFVGDYLDRGEDPKGVVDLLLELSSGRSGDVECLMGNHEGLFLEFLETGDPRLCLANGGLSTFRSYGIEEYIPGRKLIPDEHLHFFKSLKFYLDLGEFLVVHAGLRPGIPLERQSPEDLLWIRETFIDSEQDFGKVVVFGHTPFYEPLEMENKIGLDTGAVHGNKLTCLELPERRFISVNAGTR
jgi:serine/threonine protein phosphatase 1